MGSPDDSWRDSYDAWKLATPPEPDESEHPDWCIDCEEIHSARCPLEDVCDGCGYRINCICDVDCED